MFTCLDWRQVNLMRFSAVFQSRSLRPAAEGERLAAAAEAVPGPVMQAAPAQELPEDLDARVRLLGEWQVSEY